VTSYLSGKKRNIGVAFLMASAFTSQVLVGTLEVDAAWTEWVIVIGDWLGIAFGGTGLIHKRYKVKHGG